MRTQRVRSVRTPAIAAAALGLAALLAPAGSGAAPSPQDGVQTPALAAPYFAPPSAELFASNLGISYRLEPYGGSLGARLTRYPVPGSPATQIQLEPGDMIVALDGLPIFGPDDLLRHAAQTSVQFVNIRTGRPQVNWIVIPGATPGPYPDPGLGPLPFTLGVATQLTAVPNTQVYASPLPGQPAPRLSMRPSYGLRITQVVPGGAAHRAGLEVGDTIMTANGAPMSDANALRRAIATSGGTLNLTVRDVRNPAVDVAVFVPLDPSGGQVYALPAPAAPAPAPAPLPAPAAPAPLPAPPVPPPAPPSP